MVTLYPFCFYRRGYRVSCRSAREKREFVEIRSNPANFDEFLEIWDQFRELSAQGRVSLAEDPMA